MRQRPWVFSRSGKAQRWVLFGTGIALALGNAIPRASAEPLLPDATYSGNFNASVGPIPATSTNQVITGPTNLSFGGSATSCADYLCTAYFPTDAETSASLSIASTPSPGIFLSGSAATVSGCTPVACNGGDSYFNMYVGLTYYLEILGTPGTVALNVQAQGAVQQTSIAIGSNNGVDSSAHAGFAVIPELGGYDIPGQLGYSDWSRLAGGNGIFAGADLTTGLLTGPASADFKIDGNYDFQTNTLYEVLMYASIGGESLSTYGGGVDAMSAYVDPTFTIATDNASQYSLVLSSNIGNTSSTDIPEPSSMMLMTASIGVACVSRLRKRGSVRARASKYSLHHGAAVTKLCGLQDDQHRRGTTEELQSATSGGNVLIVAGARAEVVT